MDDYVVRRQSGSGDGAFRDAHFPRRSAPSQSGVAATALPPQSKTLARSPVTTKLREASWSAPVLWRFPDIRSQRFAFPRVTLDFGLRALGFNLFG
jgi:hypothetical protein